MSNNITIVFLLVFCSVYGHVPEDSEKMSNTWQSQIDAEDALTRYSVLTILIGYTPCGQCNILS